MLTEVLNGCKYSDGKLLGSQVNLGCIIGSGQLLDFMATMPVFASRIACEKPKDSRKIYFYNTPGKERRLVTVPRGSLRGFLVREVGSLITTIPSPSFFYPLPYCQHGN